MIKNITHSSIGCNGMANNDDYHGLEMYKNHAKDSTTEGYMQPDPTTMECGHHGVATQTKLTNCNRDGVSELAGTVMAVCAPRRSNLARHKSHMLGA